MNGRTLGCWLLCGLVLAACGGKKDEVVVQTAGTELGESDIDRDPLALLPGGFVGLVYVDAKKTVASPFGKKLVTLAQAQLPVPASAGFEPSRDIDRAWIGLYSMQGVDVAAVVSGRFDRAKIEKAAAAQEKTPLGGPVVVSTYAGRKLYTVQNLGFSLLTQHTALLGNETGMRRALDRMKEGRVKRQIPSWLQSMLETPNAPMVIGVDLRANPVPDAARQQLPFLNGLETARVLGNFEPPGLNFAGTLSYPDEQAAQKGAASVTQIAQNLDSYGWILALLQIEQPVRKLQARAEGKDTQFVLGVDGEGISRLLDRLQQFLGTPQNRGPVDATTSPAVKP
jgi:hypothetical protein